MMREETDEEIARAEAAEKNERHMRNLHDWRVKDLEAALARVEAAERQLAAVDAALPAWEPEPGDTVGCVGRVQTILNLIADRARAEAAEKERDEALEDLRDERNDTNQDMQYISKLKEQRDGWQRHANTSDREVQNLRVGFAAVMESLALPPMMPQLMWQDGAMSIMRRTNEIVDEANRLAEARDAAEARCATLEAALREALDWIAEEAGAEGTTDYWGSLMNRLDEALAAATPPAEGCPTCGTTPCPDCQDYEKEGT